MVHLGYGEEERAVPQAVSVDFTFYLSNLPLGCSHDGTGFMCYGRLATKLTAAIAQKHFSLIEYMALTLGGAVDAWIAEEAPAAGIEHVAYTLHLHKCAIPVTEVKGGASFTYTTLPQGIA